MNEDRDGRWLLLIHRIPPKPAYLRVKIWRRLQRLGAVAIKSTVYVLPFSEQAQEDLQWVLRAIVESGGEAMVCEARLVEGLTDEQVEALFHAARDADYARIAEEAMALAEAADARAGEEAGSFAAGIVRLERRLAEVAAIDFFGAPGRNAAERLVSALERGRTSATAATREGVLRVQDLRGRTWVTRRGIHVDRMATAWLVRRFVDPDARFKFVSGKGYRPEPGELRFDMFEAELTHDGDRCTFEVLVGRLGLHDRGLTAIAEIVHDIDLKDTKFGRPETPGIDHLIAGIATAHRDDESRLARGAAVFDDLYEFLRRRRD